MFLENNFVDMVNYMLEDILYNLMEEATYEEFDLKQDLRSTFLGMAGQVPHIIRNVKILKLKQLN